MILKKYIGIDIGGTAVKAGLVDENGEARFKIETEIDRSGTKETVMETVIKSIRALCDENGTDIGSLAGIGVAAPGAINTKEGRVAKLGGNVPNWSGTKVCEILDGEFGLPVSLANDGNCVALAEAWIGAAKGHDNVLCVALGTGVGGGIISRGKLIEGAMGYAGEIGHFMVHAGGRKCSCGGRGCFEKYAATSALVKEGMALRDNWYTGRHIFGDANAGDEEALALVDRWTDEVAYGIASLTHIFNPEVILIGGGVSAQEELVIKPVGRKIKELIIPDFAEKLVIKRAELGNDAGMVGAVRHLILEKE